MTHNTGARLPRPKGARDASVLRGSKWRRELGCGLDRRCADGGFLLGRCARQYLSWGGAKARGTRLRSAPGYVVKRRWRRLVDGFVGELLRSGHNWN